MYVYNRSLSVRNRRIPYFIDEFGSDDTRDQCLEYGKGLGLEREREGTARWVGKLCGKLRFLAATGLKEKGGGNLRYCIGMR